MVDLNDILDLMISRSCVPSTFGAQLERLKYGLNFGTDPHRAKEDAEGQMLGDAEDLRCLSEFTSRTEFEDTPILQKIQKSTSPRLDQGYIAVGIFRAYHERSSRSPERGLYEAYQFLNKIAPHTVPSLNDLQGFREGKHNKAHNLAAEAYADSLLALQNFVRIYNKKQ